jgi:hypothetical protein
MKDNLVKYNLLDRYLQRKIVYYRLCSQCNQIEDEQHFLIHDTKFANVRKLLFKKFNIKLQDLCPSEYMKTINRLLNSRKINQTLMSFPH